MVADHQTWTLIWNAVVVILIHWTVLSASEGISSKTRLVSTKYGKVQGSIRHLGGLLGDVEIFRGVPYASPPIEEGRFTPTNTPSPWEGVLDATRSPAVCPQLYPDLSEAAKSMPKERVNFIRKIIPNLDNQSEDCLTLSIYAPIMVMPGSEVYPVMVLFHGESFSWGAGSLYDGSVLAAYGRVIVVTINFRLGPLGFLNAYGGGGGVVSNFAILDQIASLSWIGENIHQFNGDPSKVTLFGRDTGAALISHLTYSPIVPPGLFHRVVLLSGGAWCPWAQVVSPLSVTLRLALALGCPVPDSLGAPSPNTVSCLRTAPLNSLMDAARNITPHAFIPLWGPSEDGVVVAREKRPTSQKSRVEWVLGFTPTESWSWLSDSIVTLGADNNIFEQVVRTWIRNTNLHHLREVMAAVLQEYTDWGADQPDPDGRRDLLIHLLSDAGTVAPMHKGADMLSDQGSKVFLFLCDLDSQLRGQIQQPGWELSLLFGAGLSDSSSTPGNLSIPLQGPILAQLSEDIITLITNFAKSGDPNLPRESPSPVFAAVAWPRYTKKDRKYLRIGMPPSIGSQYRAHQLALWNWLVPELEAAGAHNPPDLQSWETGSDQRLFYLSVRPSDPWHFLQETMVTEVPNLPMDVSAAPQAIGTTSTHRKETKGLTTTLALLPTSQSHEPHSLKSGDYFRYSTALLVTVGLGISLLMLNGLIFMLLFWKKSGSHNQKLEVKEHLGPETTISEHTGTILNMGGDIGGELVQPMDPNYGSSGDCLQLSFDKLRSANEDFCRTSQRQHETSFSIQPSFRPSQALVSRSSESDDECCRGRMNSGRNTLCSIKRYPSTTGILESHISESWNIPLKDDNPQIITLSDGTTVHSAGVPLSFQDPQDNSYVEEIKLENQKKNVPSPILKNTNNSPQTHINYHYDSYNNPIEMKNRSLEAQNCNTLEKRNKTPNSTLERRKNTSREGNSHRDEVTIDPSKIVSTLPNGWASYGGNQLSCSLPDPPPPPKVSTLRKEKKVTIVEESAHRL